ncbi:MAG: phenylacetate--CoA ligase family protein, partial [Candidatus Poribacteria bacterium]
YTIIERLPKSSGTVSKQIKRIESTTPSFLEWVAEKRLLSAFHRAASRVPHYKEFLAKKNVDVGSVKTLEDFINTVPPIDKNSYVQTCESLRRLCVDGRIQDASLLARSSGFSGKPCTWPKSYAEEKEGQMDVAVFTEYFFDVSRYKTLLINAFLLGTWIGGISLSRLTITSGISLCATGPKIEEIIEIIESYKSEYDQIFICGYPPFLKMVVDRGMEIDAGFWHDKSVRFIFVAGGEGFSEGWRDYINRCLDAQNRDEWDNYVISGFGASDLGITGFTETPGAARIRRIAHSNPEFASAMFGDDFGSLPMLFPYNPLKYYVTVNQEGELEFSTISPNALVPLIRYNLHDLGGTISYQEMETKLTSFGFDNNIDLPFPFFYVFGRTTGEISVSGTLIYPENIREALFTDHEIATQVTGRFKMATEEDSDSNIRFYVDIELKDGINFNQQLNTKYQKVIHEHLLKVNVGYLERIKIMPNVEVQVRFRKEGELENKQHIKIHYI